ncbi:MAG: DUF6325 family protein [Caldilinea sp.]
MQQTLGPVEYLVVVFEGNQFSGEIIPALSELVDNGLVRIIDLAIVSKDEEGNVLLFEASELSGEVAEALVKLEGAHDDLLSEKDLLMVAEDLPNNSTAAAMLFENVWAARFAEAVRDANGEVLMNVRIPNHVVETVRQSIVEAARQM